MNATEKGAAIVAAYKTILGRNIYSQDATKRECCFTPYKDGKHYSDCSSSIRLAYKRANIGLNKLTSEKRMQGARRSLGAVFSPAYAKMDIVRDVKMRDNVHGVMVPVSVARGWLCHLLCRNGLCARTKRLYGQKGELKAEVFVYNRTGKAIKAAGAFLLNVPWHQHSRSLEKYQSEVRIHCR